MSCAKCGCKSAIAETLTRKLAESIMKKLAADLRAKHETMTIAASEEIAMASILVKNPKLLCRCVGCKFEWLE